MGEPSENEAENGSSTFLCHFLCLSSKIKTRKCKEGFWRGGGGLYCPVKYLLAIYELYIEHEKYGYTRDVPYILIADFKDLIRKRKEKKQILYNEVTGKLLITYMDLFCYYWSTVL